jgi:hypothetical protein
VDLRLFCFGGLGMLAYGKIKDKLTDAVVGAGCLLIFIALYLDKGLGFVMGGLVVSPLHEINEYIPTANEIGITLGIWATGFFILTLLYKIAVGVEHEVEA